MFDGKSTAFPPPGCQYLWLQGRMQRRQVLGVLEAITRQGHEADCREDRLGGAEQSSGALRLTQHTLQAGEEFEILGNLATMTQFRERRQALLEQRYCLRRLT